MKKTKRILIASILLLLMLGNKTQAQTFSLIKERTKVLSFDEFDRFFFVSLGGTAGTEFYAHDKIYTQTYPSHGFNLVGDMNAIQGQSLLRIATDVRLNLIEYFDIASLSINAPIGFGLSFIEFNQHNFVAHLPLYLQLSFNAAATKTKVDNYGFHLGLGYHYFNYLFPSENGIGSDEYYESFGMYTLRFGFSKARKFEPKCVNYNFEYGLFPTITNSSTYSNYLFGLNITWDIF